MKSALFIIGTLIAAIAGSLAGGSAIWMFWSAWKDTDLEAFRALLGGFAGGFFAYVFVRFGDALKKVYDRKELNHTNLVKLQHYFNDCLNATSDNLFIISDCRGVFTDARRDGKEAPIYMNSFHQYAIDGQLVINLTNIDFINEVYSLNAGLKKLNHSLATIDHAYTSLRDAFLSKNVDVETYKQNAWQYRDRCTEVEGFLVQTKDDLIRLYAASNLLLEDRPFFLRILQRLVRRRYTKNFDARLKLETVRVKAEMEAISDASKKRIQEAQRR